MKHPISEAWRAVSNAMAKPDAMIAKNAGGETCTLHWDGPALPEATVMLRP